MIDNIIINNNINLKSNIQCTSRYELSGLIMRVKHTNINKTLDSKFEC